MANSIVSGLFGIDPLQYQAQQDALANQQAMQFAEMDPFQRANYGLFRSGQQIGKGVGEMLGAQDPQLKAAGIAQKLAGQFDTTTVDGLKQYAQALQQAGTDTGNVQLSNMSMMALDKARQLEASQYDILSKQSKMKLENAQMIKALREPDEGLKALIGKSTPASVATYLQTRNPADLVLAKEPGEEKLGETTIKEIGVASKNNKILTDTNNVLDSWLAKVKDNKVKFGVGESIKATSEGFTGQQSTNTLEQGSLKKFLSDERDNILMAAKGTQTEGDAQRAMERIFSATDWFSKQSVEKALTDLKDYKQRQINANNEYINVLKGSSRKVGGTEQSKPEVNITVPVGAKYENQYKKYIDKRGPVMTYEAYAQEYERRQAKK